MNSAVHRMEWHAGLLRGWHLAILRYAVTLDNADRLAVLRIAREIDGLDPRCDGDADFEFFRRTSAELCTAILQPDERASAILRQYLAKIDDDRLRRAVAAALDAGQPIASRASRPVQRSTELWRGLSSRGNH